MSASEEIGKMELSLQALTTIAREQAALLDTFSQRLSALENVAPSPPPAVPPPAPLPRDDAAIRLIVNQEMAKVTTNVLNPSQLAAWVTYFKNPAFTPMAEAQFRSAVHAQVVIDVNKYGWPLIDHSGVLVTGNADLK